MKFYETKIREIRKETSDTYSFIMDVPEGFVWKAGKDTTPAFFYGSSPPGFASLQTPAGFYLTTSTPAGAEMSR